MRKLHSWDLLPAEALELQSKLQSEIKIGKCASFIRTIAGVDCSISHDNKKIFAGIIVYSFPELEEVERVAGTANLEFPYIPGLLSFREGPVIINTIEKLKEMPDIFMFDGQGIAHPRFIGIASHIGLWVNRPTIGCAKSKLVGDYEEVDKTIGSWSELNYRGKTVGAVLRTRKNVEPLFVSPGHLIDLETSIHLVMATLTGFRLPKPTREADRFVAWIKRKMI